jgi:hypothetical protein
MVSFWPRGGNFTLSGVLTTGARDWLLDVVNALNTAPLRKQIASASAQTAAIATTAISLGDDVPAGPYRVSVYLRLTRAATTNSSVQVTIGWTEGAVSKTLSGAAYTGNAINTCAAPFDALIEIDEHTDLTYAVAYSSTGATSAQYAVTVLVEKVPEMQTT